MPVKYKDSLKDEIYRQLNKFCAKRIGCISYSRGDCGGTDKHHILECQKFKRRNKVNE